MKCHILLSGKEVEAIYNFYKEKQCNIAIIQGEWLGIGSCAYVQTQDDFINGKDNLIDITDYETW